MTVSTTYGQFVDGWVADAQRSYSRVAGQSARRTCEESGSAGVYALKLTQATPLTYDGSSDDLHILFCIFTGVLYSLGQTEMQGMYAA